MKVTRAKLISIIKEAVWRDSENANDPAFYVLGNNIRGAQMFNNNPSWIDNAYHFRSAGENTTMPTYVHDTSYNTHGSVSHAIKHYIEFDSQLVIQTLGSIRVDLISRIDAGEIEAFLISGNASQPLERSQSISPPLLLNTLDRINDDLVINQNRVSTVELEILASFDQIILNYNQKLDDLIQGAVDVSDSAISRSKMNDDQLVALLKSQPAIKFKATYRGKGIPNTYYLDLKTSDMAVEYPVGEGQIASFARMQKSPNGLVQIKDALQFIDKRNLTREYEDLKWAIGEIEKGRGRVAARQNPPRLPQDIIDRRRRR